MDFIRTFVTLNHEILLFIYGQVFFVLGLAIALQSRRYSRLELARSLSWLAAFGFAHGFYEWGDLFIPIQAEYLGQSVVQILHGFHLLLLAISFACLFEFGVVLLRTLHRARWLHTLPAGVLATWFFVAFFPLRSALPDHRLWQDSANALARYFIGFPAAMLAAYSLRQHALLRIAPLNVPHIVNTLRAAGVGLALYAVLGGLIVPPVAFFPGNLLNTAAFEAALGVPAFLLRSLIGLIMAVAVIRAMEVFEVETGRMIEAMEQQQILAAERERIARELHDGAIQTVYTAGLLVESAHRLAAPDSPVAGRLEKAEAVLNDAIGDLRKNLGDLRAAASGESLSDLLRSLADDARFRSLVDVSLQVDLPEDGSFSPARTEHVRAIVNEALSNAVRHARARRVNITARRSDGRLQLTIKDDGVGLPGRPRAGFGLRNMRDRARLLGGQLEITGDAGKGTTVLLDVPWKDER